MFLFENVEAQCITDGHSNGEAGVGHQVQVKEEPKHWGFKNRILPASENDDYSDIEIESVHSKVTLRTVASAGICRKQSKSRPKAHRIWLAGDLSCHRLCFSQRLEQK